MGGNEIVVAEEDDGCEGAGGGDGDGGGGGWHADVDSPGSSGGTRV